MPNAAEVEGKGRSEDDLAYLRSEREYVNCLLVERPEWRFCPHHVAAILLCILHGAVLAGCFGVG